MNCHRFTDRLVMLALCALLPQSFDGAVGGMVVPCGVLRTGDVAFRQGRSTESGLVMRADSDGLWSHTGLVIEDGSGGFLVLHIVNGEQHESGGAETVKADPPGRFWGRDRAQAGCVLRYEGMDEKQSASVAAAAERLRGSGVRFDHRYRVSDQGKLYCTELVHVVYLAAGIDLTEGRQHRFPLFEEPVILPGDIARNPRLREVWRW